MSSMLNKVSDAGPAARRGRPQDHPCAEPRCAPDRGRPCAACRAEAIFDTGLFDFDRAHEHPLWAKELYGFASHVPETEEYGITSFVYRARRPFDPARVHAVLNGDLPGVIRAKGHFWLATRPDWAAEFSLAGALSSVTPLGLWWAALPRKPVAEGGAGAGRGSGEMGSTRGATVARSLCSSAATLTGPPLLRRWMQPWSTTGRVRPELWADLADPFPVWRQNRRLKESGAASGEGRAVLSCLPPLGDEDGEGWTEVGRREATAKAEAGPVGPANRPATTKSCRSVPQFCGMTSG